MAFPGCARLRPVRAGNGTVADTNAQMSIKLAVDLNCVAVKEVGEDPLRPFEVLRDEFSRSAGPPNGRTRH